MNCSSLLFFSPHFNPDDFLFILLILIAHPGLRTFTLTHPSVSLWNSVSLALGLSGSSLTYCTATSSENLSLVLLPDISCPTPVLFHWQYWSYWLISCLLYRSSTSMGWKSLEEPCLAYSKYLSDNKWTSECIAIVWGYSGIGSLWWNVSLKNSKPF